MSENVKTSRVYDSSRRQEQARLTRRAVLDVAKAHFLERGYVATTIAAIAEDAGVSVETVYKAFGNKPGLAKTLFDVTIVGDDEPIPMMQRKFVQQNMADPDPRRRLTRYGAHIADVGTRVGPLLLVLRDAAVTDGGAAEIWQKLQAERVTGMSAFAQHLHEGGHLRRGVSPRQAADVLWAYNSVEMWDLLVRQRGWSSKRYGTWIGRQLVAALL
jgi:AcrR family transcriptional regulator